MAGAIAIIAVALCISAVEGLWVWLLATAIAEVAGQGSPSIPLVCLVLFTAWFVTRVLALVDAPTHLRRWVLIGGGLTVALIAGTIQSGLLLPLQLLFGTYTPDLRGAGIGLLLLVSYLWGRGLWLGREVTRDRVTRHIAISATALITVLVFLPLSTVVQESGLETVIGCFTLAAASLLLVQAAGVESRELTPTRWAIIAGGSLILVVIAGAALTGALSSGILIWIAGGLSALGHRLSPVTDGILLALGHVADRLAVAMRWLAVVFGVDQSHVLQNVRVAEEARPLIDQEGQDGPPGVMVIGVAIFLTAFFAAVAIVIFLRLVGSGPDGDEDDVQETREGLGGGSGIRGLFGRLPGFKHAISDLDARDARAAIRLQYRRFQIYMARAGVPRGSSETAGEFGSALSRIMPTVENDLQRIAREYAVARYSPPTTASPDSEEFEQAVRRVRSALADIPEDSATILGRR